MVGYPRGGVPERESVSAYYDLGRGGAGQPSSPPHPTMGEARRRRFGDRGSAPWEDPYSRLLGMPVEPSAGNFLQTMGARRQELYQQGASGFQGSGPLCPGQGQVHRDPEPQGGGQLRGSPVQVVCAGAVPPGLPHTVVLQPVPAPEPAGSQSKSRRRQKKKKSAAEKAEERADKECWRCHQLGHYEVDCPQPAAEPMETAHGAASAEVTPMEVSPGPSEPGRPVEEPASSSQETSSRPVAAGMEEDQSREERAWQAARARVATAHRSQRDMAGVSLDQTLSSATGRGLTVEAAASSDSRGSGRAGQLSVLKMAAATRRPGSRSESRDKGRRRARSLTREVPTPTPTAPAPLAHQYDGDARAMYKTLKWHVELMNERGGYLGVIGRRREQKWFFCDLAMGSGTRQMTQEYVEDLCSDLPPVVSSKEEVVLEEPPPSQRDGDASGVAPGGRLSPVSPHEDRLLDSDAAVASGRSGQAPGPAQDRVGSEKTQASPSSTMSRATPDYSRCPYSCRFVENRSHKLYEHAMVHLPRYVFREVYCFVCNKAFSNKTVCANHIRQQHKIEPEAAEEQYFFLIGSLLLHLASIM